MEQYILTLLNNISLSDVKVSNGALYTCNGDSLNISPCLNCLSCKITLLVKFCTSLLNHMSDRGIVTFIHDCVGTSITEDVLVNLSCLLSSLDGKDRIYTKSRARPSLCTDLIDLSLKNYTVNQINVRKITSAISNWIISQPNTLKLQFLVSLLSTLKLAVLDEIYRNIEGRGKIKVSEDIVCNVRGSIDRDVDVELGSSSNVRGDPYKSTLSPHNSKSRGYAIDLISLLPVHISKYILNLLDEASLKICSSISDNWKTIVSQVRREDVVHQKIKEQSLMLQEVSTKPIDPCFARDIDVQVPKLNPDSQQVMYNDGFNDGNKKKRQKRLPIDNSFDISPIPISREVFNIAVGFKNIKTKTVIMEERNVYCGGYSVLLLMEGISKQNPSGIRTIAYNSGDLVAVSGSNKIIEFLDVEGRKTSFTKTKIHGHAGTIKVLKIINKPRQMTSKTRTSSFGESFNDGEVLSGSYDTTIRRWDVLNRKCLKIYIGHTLTVTSLDTAENMFVSGSMDGTCKLWNYEDGRSVFTMKHKYPVTAVAISTKLCVSGDSFGIVKVWNLKTGNLQKRLVGHSKEITSVRIDSFHVLSASLDCYVLLWSSVGDFDTCIGCFRHPKPVLCMEMRYMRTITGSIDGRIRIWNILTGQCLRIIRGNSRSDPILTMVVNDNRIIINTISNILVLNFETVKWVYDNKEDIIYSNYCTKTKSFNASEERKSNNCKHSYQRYERSRFAGNVDPRIFLTPVTIKTVTSTNLNSDTYYKGRQFEDGVELTRASAWLVTPSFNKPLRLVDTNQGVYLNKTRDDNVVGSDENLNEIEEKTRTTIDSSPGRRLSYGFERQDHLTSNVDLKEVKMTLRKHIRSRPLTAAQALPDFVQKMVSQMKESSTSGRPISSFSLSTFTRRSSGPNEVDLRSKLSVEEIKNAINPIISVSVNPTIQSSSTENTPKKHKREPIEDETITSNNILTSAKKFSNRSIVEHFFVRKDWKKGLIEKKLNFDERHKVILQDLDKKEKNGNKPKNINTNLTLKTFEGSQEYMKQINKIQSDYEQAQLLAKESETYNNWLKKATNIPCTSYDKDVIRKRPRSAKI